MIDPFGTIVIEIREHPPVAALVEKRVRGGEPDPGDAQPAGSYKRFIVLESLGYTRLRRAPVQEVRLVARCYGVDFTDAAAVARAASDAIHAVGPRLRSSGVGIYGSFDDGGLGSDIDPDTKQPHEDFLIRVVAPTVRVVPIS